MHKIKKLPLSESQKIAAGQVVDRPANVVKELVENALDAGATSINVYIEESGHKSIRVIDNGCGMSTQDALLCFEHHTTSKIDHFEDLATLQTFGFRGEALASIAAVSTIVLTTKTNDALQGTRITSAPTIPLAQEPYTCATGTDICVSDLFFNIPVRKKFLKKNETESRAIITLMQAFALAHPTIHVQLFSEHTLLLNCPASIDILNRVTQVWDHSFSQQLILLHNEDHASCAIQGLISKQEIQHYNRNHIFFFVNKRWVKNYQLSQALLKGYANTLQQQRYPAAFLHITVPPDQVDINVHPRKEEVSFLQPHTVEKSIQQAVRTALEQQVSRHLQATTTATAEKKHTIPSFFSAPRIDTFAWRPTNQPSASYTAPLPTSNKSYEQLHTVETVQQQKTEERNHFECIGVYKKTYLMLEHDDGILFIDQHAAHERILFELFAKKFNDSSAISLLFPEVVTLTTNEYTTLLPHLTLLEQNSILIEPFGQHQVIVQATPVHLKNIRWHEFLQELCSLIEEARAIEQESLATVLNKKLQAQMACKAAVKAGDTLAHEQIQNLLNDLETTEHKHSCPHGRPTSWLLPLHELEKKFKRKL